MNHLLARASFGFLSRHPWQLALASLGIALGVAVVVAIDLASSSATMAFTQATETVVGKATHRVVPGPDGMDERLYVRLRVREGLTKLRPAVEGYVTLSTKPSRHLRLLGIDPLVELSLNDRHLGAMHERHSLFLELLSQPGAMLLSKSTAERLSASVGDVLPASAGTRRGTLRLIGLVDPKSEGQTQGIDELIIADIATAQEVLGMEGRLSYMDFSLSAEHEAHKQLAHLERVLPSNTRVLEIGVQQRSVQNMTRAFYSNLTALSLLALLVGSCLIYNTMSFLVVQRRELIGGLRALGVTRREILFVILLEALLLGSIATLTGALLGTALANSLLSLIARTVNDFYFPVAVSQLTLSPWVYVKAALVGVCASVLAATIPAREAARATPKAALGRSYLERRTRILVVRSALCAVVGLLIGSGIIPLSSRSLAFGITGLFVLLLACTLMTPLVMVALMRMVQPVLGRYWGIVGSLSARFVSAALSRTAVSVGALMLAVATTIGIALMIESLRHAVAQWLGGMLRADLYLSVPSEVAAGSSAVIDPQLAARIKAIPGVQAVSSVRRVRLQTDKETTEIIAYEMASESYDGFRFIHADPSPPWAAFHRGAIIVSEPFAYHRGLKPGSRLKLPTDVGDTTFRVAGVFTSYGSDRGVIAMERKQFDRYWHAPGYSALGLYASPGADLDRIREKVDIVAAERVLEISKSRDIRETSMKIFDQTFLITEVLRFIAATIAFVGVLNALLALEFERFRDLAILRALGLTPRQLWSVVLTETGLMGSVAGLLALPSGVLMGVVLVHVVNRRAFGWSMEFQLAPEILAQGLLLAVVASLLAGLYPAYKMANIAPASAMREE